jgi:outer membrane protein OmpA-like peptidoglycan-associated protein
MFRNMLLAATVLAMPVAAYAQPVDGPYVAGGAGVNITQDETLKTTAGNGHLSTNPGAVGVLSGGWGFGNGLRAELEGSYRYNSLDKLRGGGGSTHLSGSEQKYGPMVNVLYDFTALSLPVVPYVGAGAGYQWAREKITAGGGSATRTEGAFAYQGIVGAAIPTPQPGLALTVEYRFLGLSGDRNYDGLKLGNDYNHSVLLGFRYAFGTPVAPIEPVAAAVPASPISRSYLVFFDWDRAVLTDRARAIVSEAAANSTKVQYTRLEVNGYTDTSGTPKYNQGLSVRRAQAVAAELVKDGVPKAAISIQGFGETHLLVQTGANVREPQNRRVEIIIK